MQTDRQELLTLALDIGRGLLENGAETYRVEESVNRILVAYGIPKAEVFAIPTCIITSISEGGDTSSRVERIFHRGTNLDRVMKLNSLSRWICNDLPSVEEIRERLNAILRERSYPLVVKVIGFSLVAAAFTVFLGGGPMDALVAALCGVVTKPVIELLERYQMNIFFADIIGGALIAGVALLAAGLGLTSQVDLVIIGALMNLVPGVAITNSMRDIIAGDLVAGLAKLIEALIIGTAIALGTGLSFVIASFL
jgi:uncharacterized membrane protein YjjP (DUF1212 family)